MVWCIITKWTEQSEHLFSQESLDHTTHLVFIEILNFTKKKKKKSPAELIKTQGRQVVDVIARELKQDQNMSILQSFGSDNSWKAF